MLYIIYYTFVQCRIKTHVKSYPLSCHCSGARTHRRLVGHRDTTIWEKGGLAQPESSKSTDDCYGSQENLMENYGLNQLLDTNGRFPATWIFLDMFMYNELQLLALGTNCRCTNETTPWIQSNTHVACNCKEATKCYQSAFSSSNKCSLTIQNLQPVISFGQNKIGFVTIRGPSLHPSSGFQSTWPALLASRRTYLAVTHPGTGSDKPGRPRRSRSQLESPGMKGQNFHDVLGV